MNESTRFILCEDQLSPETVYAGIIEAISSNQGELNVIVAKGGRKHFTSCSIAPLFDLIRQAAETLSEGFNKEIGGIEDAKECATHD